MNKDWWPYSKIRFTKPQVLWIIGHLDLLRQGFWPPEPVDTGYTGGKGKPHQREGPFVRAIVIAGEVDARLTACGIYGKLLLAEVESGKELWQLQDESRLALRYCSGWRRKRMPFLEWKRKLWYRIGTFSYPFFGKNLTL